MTEDFESTGWKRGVVPFASIDQYATSFSPVWDLEFRQMDRSEGDGGCRFVTDGKTLIYDERYPATIAFRGSLGKGLIGFSLADVHGRRGKWLGQEHPEHALAFADDRKQLDLLLPRSTGNLVAVLPIDAFIESFERLSHRPADKVFPSGNLFLPLEPTARMRLETAWRGLLAGARTSGPLTDALVVPLVAAVDRVAGEEPMDRRHAIRLFNRAMEACEASERPMTSPGELATLLGVNLRTLQLAFRTCCGIAPCRYLRMIRLNRVHRTLSRLGPGDTSVQAAAIDGGFMEFGRFSRDYRRLFGELPSETLWRRWCAPKERLPGLS